MSFPLLTKLRNLDSAKATDVTKDAILESIQNEISRLFETRSSKRIQYEEKVNILDYGVIDNIFEQFTDELETVRAESYIRRLVEHFEPRASNVNVNLMNRNVEAVALSIEFEFEFDNKIEEVSFKMDARKLN